jgi:hypothetical protein
MAASKNLGFAKMPHKEAPIRHVLEPIRNHRQGAENFTASLE